MTIRSINTNLPSLGAQRQLARVTSELDKSYQRLSSGLRINRASDDAAGLAVAKNLEADSRVYKQGIRNLNDAASYLDIADGAVGSLKTILFRARELATQAANGTLGDSQRSALNKEMIELSKEYNRIIQVTEFNGSKIFESQGTTPTTIQFGYGSNESIALETGAGPLQADTEFADISTGGASGNGTARLPSMSGDNRYVVFSSVATNLVSGDTNGVEDVFLRDRLSGTTRRISTGVGGAEANGLSTEASLSYDGRFVVYRSNATNIVSGDTNGFGDIFVYDISAGSTERISLSTTGTQGNASSVEPDISADGRYVTYISTASNFVSGDTNTALDVFRYDRQSRTNERVSVSSTGAQLAAGGESARMSGDGSVVAFLTLANVDGVDSNGVKDIAVWRRSTGTSVTGTIGVTGTTGNATSTGHRLSLDGTTLVWGSTSTDLVAGDTNGVGDVFARNLVTGVTTMVSYTDDEALSNGLSFNSTVSADGRFVAFYSSGTNLVTGDTNALDDIFVRDTVAGTTTRASMGYDGSESNGSFMNAAISGDGQYVQIISNATNLVANDTNGAQNIFITRNTGISRAVGFTSVITPLVGIGIGGQKQAQMAQSTLDDYLSGLNVSVGKLGATASRVQAEIAVVQNRSDNYTEAGSRIMDADVAEESATLAKRQVVQRAAQQVLALANADMQLVKQFLGIA